MRREQRVLQRKAGGLLPGEENLELGTAATAHCDGKRRGVNGEQRVGSRSP